MSKVIACDVLVPYSGTQISVGSFISPSIGTSSLPVTLQGMWDNTNITMDPGTTPQVLRLRESNGVVNMFLDVFAGSFSGSALSVTLQSILPTAYIPYMSQGASYLYMYGPISTNGAEKDALFYFEPNGNLSISTMDGTSIQTNLSIQPTCFTYQV